MTNGHTPTTPDLWVPRSFDTSRTKAADIEALNRVADSVTAVPAGPGIGGPSGLVLYLAAAADNFPRWGGVPRTRDLWLREFIADEGLLLSALATVSARNMAMTWKITGDEATAEAAVDMANNSNFGKGWENFIGRLSNDLYTQDNGAFVELIREDDDYRAPVLMLANLDSARCQQTGDPWWPVNYHDTEGRIHRMPWYSVVHLLEMPSGVHTSRGGFFHEIQYSAVSRVLKAAQIWRNITIYRDEKTAGRFMRGLHLISGVNEAKVQDALTKANIGADAQGLQRYMTPAIISSVDPRAEIKHAMIELATLPEGWDEKEALDAYILALSIGFLTDYQEFAPLPGGGLGTSTQSETLHNKARGKGPGLFQRMIARLMNLHGVLPEGVVFEWDEQDAEADEQAARTRAARATARSTDIASKVLDPIAGRQQMIADGELTQEQFDELAERDEERKAEEERQAAEQAAQLAALNPAGPASADNSEEGEDGGKRPPRNAVTREGEDGDRKAITGERAVPEGVPFGKFITSRLHRAYSTTSDDVSSLGYFDTLDDRIAVANAIGPALEVFEEGLREAGIWEMVLSPEDADRLVTASLAAFDAGTKASPLTELTEERLDFEEDVALSVQTALRRAERLVRARIADPVA